jgi:hypothetical protein
MTGVTPGGVMIEERSNSNKLEREGLGLGTGAPSSSDTYNFSQGIINSLLTSIFSSEWNLILVSSSHLIPHSLTSPQTGKDGNT